MKKMAKSVNALGKSLHASTAPDANLLQGKSAHPKHTSVVMANVAGMTGNPNRI
jgi:hypothetical protein